VRWNDPVWKSTSASQRAITSPKKEWATREAELPDGRPGKKRFRSRRSGM
jgi:hypothetical protein